MLQRTEFLLGIVRSRLGRIVCGATILFLIEGVAAAVYLSGGTAKALPHLAYVPIIIGAAAFGWRGGLATALACGLALGPWMPLDVARGLTQSPGGWLMRMAMFALAGGLAGGAFSALTMLIEALHKAGFQAHLSGLQNQQALLMNLRKLRRGLLPGQTASGIILFELTRYQDILSTFGYRHAKVLARAVAARLQEVKPQDGEVYELPSGIFAYVLKSPTLQRLQHVSETTIELLDADRRVADTTLPTELRAGVSPPMDARHPPMEILRTGYAALMTARAKHVSVATYDADMTNQWRRAAALLAAFRSALDEGGQLYVAYQPKMDLRTRECVGAEALIRWHHPSLGFISPAEFIPIIERSGLIDRLTFWMIQEATAQIRAWQASGILLQVAVNASIRNLEHPHFAQRVLRILEQTGVAPEMLEIEVTEGAFMRYADQCRASLDQLRTAGVGVALDDFGTGHSSLSLLRDLPLTTVKLDRSFIANLGTASGNVTIVPILRSLMHKLGFGVTAEGVETRETAEMLSAWGCEYGQGYFWSKPIPAAEFTAWVQERRALAQNTGLRMQHGSPRWSDH